MPCFIALYINKMGSHHKTNGLMLVLHLFYTNTNVIKPSLVREPGSDRLERYFSFPFLFLEFQMVKRNMKSSLLVWQLTEKYLFAFSNTQHCESVFLVQNQFTDSILLLHALCNSFTSASCLLEIRAEKFFRRLQSRKEYLQSFP